MLFSIKFYTEDGDQVGWWWDVEQHELPKDGIVRLSGQTTVEPYKILKRKRQWYDEEDDTIYLHYIVRHMSRQEYDDFKLLQFMEAKKRHEKRKLSTPTRRL